MSDLSYLDTLSEKELLAKCLEHGLPGIPVTDSTRNVIIRRLRATILGLPLNKGKTAASAKKKTAPRRETIHGSKVTPAAENVGRTAGKSPSRSGNSSFSSNNNNNQSAHSGRRTIAYGLDNISVSGRSVETTTTVSDVGSQSEDDDFHVVDSPVRYSNLPQMPPNRKDVSLSKSGVLTTSYTREVEQPLDERQEQDIPKSHNYERAPLNTFPSYVPRLEQPYRRPMYLDLNALSKTQNVQTQLNSISYQEDAGPRNTFSGSAKPFGEVAATQPRQLQSGSTTGFRQPLQPRTSKNTLYPTLNQFYDQPDNNAHPMETDSESEAEEEPQLRGSHLSRARSSPLARPTLSAKQKPGQVSPMTHFRELYRSLDRQYHLKLYFLLCVSVMVVTMLYVVLTPAV
ncbi:LEM domain-containing protein Bocksbeutel [Drosophila miranda]|uniref:LEM domain-containing protein Bocksbeutel n=1 Tax=Drosophila miranda TaxID=7229 RepID=UPI0007E883BA|nr:LEM domain-containing protein Bocksbeutel [Drosophila miranda]